MTDLFEIKLAFAPISDDPEREQAILDDKDEEDEDEDAADEDEDGEDEDDEDLGPTKGIADEEDGGLEE